MADVRVDGHLLAVPVDFCISSARIRYSHHLVVQLRAGDLVGAGEGVLYRTQPHQVASLFQRLVQPAVEKRHLLSSGSKELETWSEMLASASPALAYAVDTALWDLKGKEAGRPVAELLGGARRQRIPITEQIFIRHWPKAEVELDAMLSRGTRRLKLKVGAGPQVDLESARRVRAFVGPEFEIRVDANRAYSLADGEALYKGLADLGILALEEPLSGRNWSDLRALRRRVGLPVVLDENVLNLDDLQDAIAEDAIDILNIKLTRVGGISQALKYAEICRRHDVEVAIGCAEDLGIGMAAILHTAAALPDIHSAEGIGPLRLGFDLVTDQWEVKDGALTLPRGSGLGVTLREDWAGQLPCHVHCFDLSRKGWQLQAFSRYARWFQRANNVLWRAHRGRLGKCASARPS